MTQYRLLGTVRYYLADDKRHYVTDLYLFVQFNHLMVDESTLINTSVPLTYLCDVFRRETWEIHEEV
jgi:hypothetical protein